MSDGGTVDFASKCAAWRQELLPPGSNHVYDIGSVQMEGDPLWYWVGSPLVDPNRVQTYALSLVYASEVVRDA